MINISRATEEIRIRSYFAPRGSHPPFKFYSVKDFPQAVKKITDEMRERMRESDAREAASKKLFESLAQTQNQNQPRKESLLTQYSKLTTDAEKEAFIQKEVDENMASYEARRRYELYEQQQRELANLGTSVSPADQSRNASERSAAIGMYQGVQNMGDTATTIIQSTGAAA